MGTPATGSVLGARTGLRVVGGPPVKGSIVQHVNSVHHVSGAAGLVLVKSTPVSIRLSIKLTYSVQDILSFYLKCVLYVRHLFLYGYFTSCSDMMAAMLCC